MWGWVSRAAMSISRRNRSFPRAAPRSGLSTLRATRRRCFRSSARYTVAMPPRPSSRLIVYRSASATWSRPGTPLIQRKDTVGVGAQRAYGRGAGPGLLILRPRLYRQHVTTPDPLPDDSWAVDERSLKAFADKLKEPPAERAWYELRREAERIALVPGFDRLITLDANAIKELPHQIDVAQRVLRDMGGRAILADEVGLGKTIEASIIYKELAIRGLARRALILTPASLVGQWQGELQEKFFERFETPTDPKDWQRITKAIVSHDRARSRRHAEEILRHRWDLVIVDEAHKVKSERSATYRFIEKIERDFILLLTATPLQNDLRELYNLITLLRPGQLGTWPEFRAAHLVEGDQRQPRDPEGLRALTESLEHLAQGERVSPAYRGVARQLARRARAIKTHAKLDVLTKLLKDTPDRLVVFSDHRPTIELIAERVTKLGRQAIVYWGTHSTSDRDKRIRAFHDDQRSVLIATRAGSEGRNLQFCNVLVNYDLPWNPMVVEQRIGRLHRIGQTREVHIVNLAAAGTIESYILQLLDQKIKL